MYTTGRWEKPLYRVKNALARGPSNDRVQSEIHDRITLPRSSNMVSAILFAFSEDYPIKQNIHINAWTYQIRSEVCCDHNQHSDCQHGGVKSGQWFVIVSSAQSYFHTLILQISGKTCIARTGRDTCRCFRRSNHAVVQISMSSCITNWGEPSSQFRSSIIWIHC